VHVGDTALSLADPGALQLDVLGSEAVEQTAPLAEEHWDDMKLELVEHAGSKCEPCDSGACDGGVGASVALEFMPKRNSELIGIRG
jgi:hypothetical protein